MPTTGIHYYATAERPDLRFWLLDDTGALVNLSSGYTFEFKIGSPGTAAVFTKSTGITGAAGSGSEPDGTPNLVVTFTAGELDAVPTGTYMWQIKATSGGLDRFYQGMFSLGSVIT